MVIVCLQGSCYTPNMGNAFVYMGALACLRHALGTHGKVFQIGDFGTHLLAKQNQLEKHFPYDLFTDCDYYVNAGMNLCTDHFIPYLPIYRRLTEKGVKLIFLGAGASLYNPREVALVSRAMSKVPIYALITRDSYSFHHYHRLAYNTYDGIDCSLHLYPHFAPPFPLNNRPFNIMTFDHYKEPRINHRGNEVIHLHHNPIDFYYQRRRFLHNTFLSDLPTDYLNLYYHADVTYSDRVHACLPALAFGRAARLFFKPSDRRLFIFHRLGLTDIYRRPVSLPSSHLLDEVAKQIHFLKETLLKGGFRHPRTKLPPLTPPLPPIPPLSAQYSQSLKHRLNILKTERANFVKRLIDKITLRRWHRV